MTVPLRPLLTRLLIPLLAAVACQPVRAQWWSSSSVDTPNYEQDAEYAPLHEARAVWLATIGGIDWPRTLATDASSMRRQQRELTNMLDRLQHAGINTVILQTRIRGTVIYPSAIEPYDDCLTGTLGRSPGYDPLAFAVDECHRRGMELHAWVVCIPLGTNTKQRELGSASILRRHPTLCKTVRGQVFMRPDQNGTAEYIARLCQEIARKYDVDGISFDYIRYPEKTYAYTDNLSPKQRLNAINRIVQAVHDSIKPCFPWIKLSSSPLGRYASTERYDANGWECLAAVYQDPRQWLREGWQDMLFPMMYYRGDYFYPFLFDWLENNYGRPVIPGLGIYFLDPQYGQWRLDDLRAEMHTARQALCGGMAFYRAQFLLENHQGLLDATTQELFTFPALPLPMTWQTEDTLPPEPPADLHYRQGVLHWQSVDPAATNEQSYIVYNVYASDHWPVDTTTPANLLAQRLMADSLVVSGYASARSYFAVTASDRFGNESDPVQEPPLRPQLHQASPLTR